MTDRKTILLIGKTGNGKSTLANVPSGTNLFTESAGSTSETRELNIQLIEIKLLEGLSCYKFSAAFIY